MPEIMPAARIGVALQRYRLRMASEWLGETTDASGKTDMEQLEKAAVMRLVTDGGCKGDVAQQVVHALINVLRQ